MVNNYGFVNKLLLNILAMVITFSFHILFVTNCVDFTQETSQSVQAVLDTYVFCLCHTKETNI